MGTAVVVMRRTPSGIAGEWTTNAEKRRVKSYVLTAAGLRQLAAQRREWDRIVTAVAQVLETG